VKKKQLKEEVQGVPGQIVPDKKLAKRILKLWKDELEVGQGYTYIVLAKKARC
jgi:hypothetical protein